MIVKIFTESLCGGMCHSIFLKLLFQNTNLKGKWLKERKGIDGIFKQLNSYLGIRFGGPILNHCDDDIQSTFFLPIITNYYYPFDIFQL